MFTRILVGADDSATARRAVETAIDLAAALRARLDIVTAYQAAPAFPQAVFAEFPYEAAAEPADALLQELAALAIEKDVAVEFHAESGDAAEVLVRVADAVGADLVVVGNRGMQGVRRVLGSVPNSVAHRAGCSVLIVDTTE